MTEVLIVGPIWINVKETPEDIFEKCLANPIVRLQQVLGDNKIEPIFIIANNIIMVR